MFPSLTGYPLPTPIPDQPCVPQGPALHASLQDSASLLGTQSSEEQFERKFSAKIQALRGLRRHTHRAALLDPQPWEPSPCLLTHREASHALAAAGREGHEGR